MSVLDKLRRATIALSERAQAHETGKLLRKGVLTAGAFALRPDEATERLEGLAKTMALHEGETATWVPVEEIEAGRGGPFALARCAPLAKESPRETLFSPSHPGPALAPNSLNYYIII